MKRHVAMCVVGLAMIVAGCVIQAGKLNRGCKRCHARSPDDGGEPAAAETPDR